MLEILNELILSCIETHAPTPLLKTFHMAKPHKEAKISRVIAHRDNTPESWSRYRELRNKMKRFIKSTKKHFYKTDLTSKKRPKEILSCVNKIIHPNPNIRFNATAQCLTNAIPTSMGLSDSVDNNLFVSRLVYYHEVEPELKSLVLDVPVGMTEHQ